MYTIKPTGYRVLVKILPPQEIKTKGGLVIETNYTVDAEKGIRTVDGATARKAQQEATVVALGKDAFKGFGDGLPWCKIDDVVMIPRYCGEDRTDFNTGIIYRVLNDDDILAVIEHD